MRILQLTPGTGTFLCGSCLRDNTLVVKLRERGHDALIAPLYLPFALEGDQQVTAEGAEIFAARVADMVTSKLNDDDRKKAFRDITQSRREVSASAEHLGGDLDALASALESRANGLASRQG